MLDRWGQPIGDPITHSRDSNGFDRPTSPPSNMAPSPSAVSEPSSAPASGSGADFGGDDPVDSQPDPGDWRADFRAWLASCKSQLDLASGLPKWRAFTKERYAAGDVSFRGAGGKDPPGENTVWMQDEYGKRKGQVSA